MTTPPDPNSDLPAPLAHLLRVVNSPDPFRVVIRGFVVIDEVLDRLIDDAFDGGRPKELDRLRLPARVALARALSLLPAELGKLIDDLGKIRHRLAHTSDDTVSEREVEDLYSRVVPNMEEMARTALAAARLDMLTKLRIVITTLYAWLVEAVTDAHEQRAEMAAALDLWRSGGTAARQQQLLEALLGEDAPEVQPPTATS